MDKTRQLAWLRQYKRKMERQSRHQAAAVDEEHSRHRRCSRRSERYPATKNLPSVEDVDHLLREEKKDIDEMYLHGSMKHHRMLPSFPRLVEKKEDRLICKLAEDDLQEDVPPETAAAIMHTKEQGLHLGVAPRRLYNWLFPPSPGEAVLPVRSLEPRARYLKDYMIPLLPPTAYFHQAYEEAAVMAAGEVHGAKEILRDSCEDETHLVNKFKSIMGKNDDKFKGLWGPSTRAPDPDSEQLLAEVESPASVNRVQLRGSTSPPWFPGYFMIMPELDQPTVSESPSQVLMSAWKAAHPDNLADNAMFLLGHSLH